MITKCCACGTVLRATSDLPPGAISHGYCKECAEAVVVEYVTGRGREKVRRSEEKR